MTLVGCIIYGSRFLTHSDLQFQVLLTTPTTPTERMKAIVEASEGFVYLVSFLFLFPPRFFSESDVLCERICVSSIEEFDFLR